MKVPLPEVEPEEEEVEAPIEASLLEIKENSISLSRVKASISLLTLRIDRAMNPYREVLEVIVSQKNSTPK